MFLRRSRAAVASASGVELDAAAGRRHGVRRTGGAPLVLPTMPVLQQILDEYGLVHTIDEDGDLAVRWERCNLYFFHYGERDEVLQARLYLNRRYDVDLRQTLMAVLDDWNRTRLFPKAYTVLPDDGMVGVCAEHALDLDEGVPRAQLKYTIGVWVQTLLHFADWIDEQL